MHGVVSVQRLKYSKPPCRIASPAAAYVYLPISKRIEEYQELSALLIGAGSGATETIQLLRLDDQWESADAIDLIKIVVEGHELAVLRGSRRLLKRGLIRNIVFEDFRGVDSEVAVVLRDAGYTVWQIGCNLRGPCLSVAGMRKQAPWLPSNFLASLNPVAAEAILRPRGWSILRPRSSQT